MQKVYYVLRKHIAKVQTCYLNKFTLMQFKILYKNLIEIFLIIHDTINHFFKAEYVKTYGSVNVKRCARSWLVSNLE